VLMLPLLVWLTPDLRIKKSLLKCNWTIRKRLPRCKMRLKKRLLAFSRRLHARIRKTRYMHKMRSEERFSRNAETDLVCRLLLEKKNALQYVVDQPRLVVCLAHPLDVVLAFLPEGAFSVSTFFLQLLVPHPLHRPFARR